MLVSVMTSEKSKMLILGLTDLNMKRLLDDEPIQKSLGDYSDELKGWELSILGPEDTVRFMAQTGVIADA